MKRVSTGLAVVAAAVAAAGALPVLAGGATHGLAAKPPPARPRVIVSLSAAPTGGRVGGDAVSVVGRARPLPAGDRLLLERRRSAGAWMTLTECARSSCRGTWTEANEATVDFRARVVRRRSITKGPIAAVVATSPVLSVHWAAPAPPPPPPPPPPPAPAAKAGKYCGFNDQGRTVCLDVAADGITVTSFTTQSIVTCTDGSEWSWLLTFGGRTVTLANLGFTYSYSGPISGGGSLTNIQIAYSLSGTFDTAGNAQGTIALSKISWDQAGTHYDCSSAPYGWHARLGA